MSRPPTRPRRAELTEALDRVLNEGAVLRGDVVLSVAGVDLLYLDLRLFLSSVETALDQKEEALEPVPPDDPASPSRE